ncbi:methyltetrahydrofolate cobalamin methyltransferase [Parasporobacterium paucivorans]|uniref:5-methyltetrahydrofolate--homocysteine methyltransferase n=1 Tax=Parasporobacterium paucivorans DSM 15970 TaxID=1122934 RepID=A0A1M6GA70_9FIRM|nr:methyltetrahydrofolate cobalamin methyltransferase [Parasporobacterium paucivorans]SHJ06870.1 5-methyltetrahydrofolate--homocysteine methyltransferase [Parasporobacterium paucivorans DSM 15970]
MIIIGEKINGSIPSVAKAIAEKDAEFIKDLARRQAEAGADFIDVCASVDEDIEVETLKWLIDCVQEVTDVPISIDSPSPTVIVGAIPFCKREGLVNSVSMEGKKVDIIFPVIADTKWECVALCNDDTGIPKSSEDRLRVFKNLMEKVKEYNIDPSRLHIDPLVEMLCTTDDAMPNLSHTIAEIKKQYPTIHVTGAVSNISFNLPVRRLVNQAFLVLAMNAGMDSAIFDPLNRDLMGVMYATEALMGLDDYSMEYITAYREGKFGPVK